jgi:hypothetical protein|tara:strand:+ start:562 stop:828 length:267 start_codon:yes stop_codon:yes gene_type:complete
VTSNITFPFVFKVGDLVQCSYDYGLTWWIDEDGENKFYGIILQECDRNMYFPYGRFYKVLCTDGYVRYFAEWELIYPNFNEDKEDAEE